MHVTSIRLKNFRSFKDSSQLELSAMNVLIGANNSGKSTILKALYCLQDGNTVVHQDIRLGIGSEQAEMFIGVEDVGAYFSGNKYLLDNKPFGFR
jgi:predicted ATP-dependent endonuclease of OLD family